MSVLYFLRGISLRTKGDPQAWRAVWYPQKASDCFIAGDRINQSSGSYSVTHSYSCLQKTKKHHSRIPRAFSPLNYNRWECIGVLLILSWLGNSCEGKTRLCCLELREGNVLGFTKPQLLLKRSRAAMKRRTEVVENVSCVMSCIRYIPKTIIAKIQIK